MRRLFLLVASCFVMSLAFASVAAAQTSVDCSQVLNGESNSTPLTPAILLSCDLSPEAIGQGPSIGGPNGVGENNACSDLPDGSATKIACYEELIAGLPGRGQPAPGPDSVTGTPFAPDVAPSTTSAQYADDGAVDDDEVAALPDTGGPSLGALAAAGGIFLVASGLLIRRRLN